MPFYEYRCDACGHAFEAMQKISDSPLTDCPSCSEAELKKLVSAAGFRLKGGGWYETDFKKDNRRNLADGAEYDEKGSGSVLADTRSSSFDRNGETEPVFDPGEGEFVTDLDDGFDIDEEGSSRRNLITAGLTWTWEAD